ncbi:MAG: magnesium transporter [Spirochaetota bacterium]|nr:MAG: magnesium transporter [Spirochaetota bacterium]
MEDQEAKSNEKIEDLIAKRSYFELKTVLKDMLAYDIMETIRPLETGVQVILFRLLNKDTAAEVFSLLEHEEQENLLRQFGTDEIKQIIEEMDPDDRTDLFDELPDEMVKRLIRHLSPDERKIANRLLNYPEDSAGRLMTPEFIELRKDLTAEKALTRIQKIGLNKETIYYSYITDEKGMLIGIVSLKDLLLAPPDKPIEDFMETSFVSVNTFDDQEDVAKVLSQYDLNALPVKDKAEKLVGIITVDDVVDVIQEEAEEDFHKMAGIEAPEDPYFSTKFFTLGRKRALWLIILLVTSYLSSVVLKHYSQILQIVIPLAFFIPMLTGTCGNTGMQSATLIIRGLATGDIQLRDFFKVFSREILMGGFLGVILGVFSFVRAHFIDVNPFIGIAVGIAVFTSVIVANVIGTILPILLKKLKIDPAISAGPFISTIIDVTSLILYFEIAQIIFNIKI